MSAYCSTVFKYAHKTTNNDFQIQRNLKYFGNFQFLFGFNDKSFLQVPTIRTIRTACQPYRLDALGIITTDVFKKLNISFFFIQYLCWTLRYKFNMTKN